MIAKQTADDRHILIAALLANQCNGETQKDIAAKAGVSLSTVAVVNRKLTRAATAKNLMGVGYYRMLLQEHLPIEDRVKALAKTVQKADSNPFAALKGIEYADAIDGLNPKAQQNDQVEPNIRPMFSLPPGSTVSVSISTPQAAIDVTPEDDEGYKNDL